MITGYILYRHRDAPKIPHIKAINLCLWGLSVFTLFIVIFGVSEGKLNLAMTSFYVSFGHTGNRRLGTFHPLLSLSLVRSFINKMPHSKRQHNYSNVDRAFPFPTFFSSHLCLRFLLAWGFALMWITLSCCWGLAKPINSLLSYNGFYPLSRLTYCTYLIHPTIMMITSFQCESPLHLAHGIVVGLLNVLISASQTFVQRNSFTDDGFLGQCSRFLLGSPCHVADVWGADNQIAEIVLPKMIET